MNKQQLTSLLETEYSEFNNDISDPETLKEWEAQFRRENWHNMRIYLKHFPDATPEEKKALRNWVRKGHSPYENGDYIYGESGWPLDFINAMRFQEDLYQEFLNDKEGFLERLHEQTTDTYSSSNSDDDDLPY